MPAREGTGEYVDVPGERKVIDQIATRYREGAPLQDLANALTSENVPTTTGGRRWSQQAVAAILKRERVALRPRGRQARVRS